MKTWVRDAAARASVTPPSCTREATAPPRRRSLRLDVHHDYPSIGRERRSGGDLVQAVIGDGGFGLGPANATPSRVPTTVCRPGELSAREHNARRMIGARKFGEPLSRRARWPHAESEGDGAAGVAIDDGDDGCTALTCGRWPHRERVTIPAQLTMHEPPGRGAREPTRSSCRLRSHRRHSGIRSIRPPPHRRARTRRREAQFPPAWDTAPER